MGRQAAKMCAHTRLQDDLHEFTFHSSHRDALKAWANHIEQLQLKRLWYNRGAVQILLDTRAAPGLSVRVLFEYLSDYNRPYPQLVPPQVQLACLHSDQFEVKEVYYQFADLMPVPTSIAFFQERATALGWLQKA